MASSHSLKNPNTGEGTLTAQEKSMGLKEPQAILEASIPHKTTYIHPKQIHDYMDYKFDFNDVLITPKVQTNIISRYDDNQVNPYYINDYGFPRLPLFTAPMDSVVNLKNSGEFHKNKINVVLPRTIGKFATLGGVFNSYGLNDTPRSPESYNYILLDIANGHMSKVLEWCANLKSKYPNVKIMAGNIANPETYRLYCQSGMIDYARVGIGNGNGCLTTQQTGVGYPMGSLIRECYQIKQTSSNPVKIVADGGMKDYADIIKALALGADYVMIGSIFSKALESAAPASWRGISLSSELAAKLYSKGFNIKKRFRGMSTKGAQKALGNNTMKTSEGVERIYNVEYTLEQWVKNFESYLRSNMSYSNANRLENFIGKAEINFITENAFNRFNK